MHKVPIGSLSAFVGSIALFMQRAPRTCRFQMSDKRKYYAIRGGKGGYRGVVNTWAECERLIRGVSNVKFKSFKTLDEAKVFTGATPSTSSASGSVFKSGRKRGTVPRKLSTLKGALTVFTDGACSRNGKTGASAGYGVFFGDDHTLNVSDRLVGNPTNQRAEMTAVIMAMKVAFEECVVSPKRGLLVMTDSMYTLNGMTQWIKNWKRNNWQTSTLAPVKNKDLWVILDIWQTKYAEDGIPFDIIWVKGHDGTPGNEAADRLAVAGLMKAMPTVSVEDLLPKDKATHDNKLNVKEDAHPK